MALPSARTIITLVGGSYHGLFGTVKSYTPAFIHLCPQHNLAGPWAQSTKNTNAIVSHFSMWAANLAESAHITLI
jgi:hypothetical protein